MKGLVQHVRFPAVMLRLLLACWLALSILPLAPVLAQGDAQGQTLDYAAWNKAAGDAEAGLASDSLTDAQLDDLRASIADWRAKLTVAQSTNATRIATVRDQISALGPAPEGDATEADEIAKKRKELGEQLALLQAPGIAAEEAYRRADGLIREIDTKARERQADQLLQLWPSPVNPANWPTAALGMTDTAVKMWGELSSGWNNSRARTQFYNSLPLIILLLVVAVATTVFARPWIEAFADRLRIGKTEARRRVFGLLASLGQIIVPSIGMIALSVALIRTGFMGQITGQVAMSLPVLGGLMFFGFWIAARVFPKVEDEQEVLPLEEKERREGRVLASLMGAVLALETLRRLLTDGQSYEDAVNAVSAFPILVGGAMLLWRMGRILRISRAQGEAASYGTRLLGLIGQALKVIAVVGPVLAAFGYVTAGSALVYQAILSLGLLAVLIILQRFLADLWTVIYPAADAEAEKERLVPVLMGFVLGLASIPLFALIWGSRVADLSEIWTRFSEGFQLGDTRVSPSDFLLFAVIFVIGYLITRLFQGALRNTILPRTKMDRGGQNALVSGTGYVGIFIAALVAINATGIDLSGLAIVASALSVGIGFGLQNIVQNFVSGIILMIERPVSEGDWIEVGTTQGIVKTISVRSTRIQTFDRNVVVVPNADLVSQRVTNWTRFGLAGRLIVPVTVAWNEDTKRVEKILHEIAEAQPMVILNPRPIVVLQGFTGGLNFELRVILRDVNFSGSVRSDINHMIVQRFIAEGVRLPSTSAEITLGNPEQLGAALRGGSASGRAEDAGARPPAPLADPQ